MTKTMTRKGRSTHRTPQKASNYRIAHDVQRIIKKAMTQTNGRTNGIGNKIGKFLTGSLSNAKNKTDSIHNGVAKYSYRKPYTTLGLAMLTGAALAIVVNKSLEHTPRRYFFRK